MQISFTVVEENGKQLGGGSGNCHIHLSILVEIARDDEGWFETDRITLPRLQRPVPIAEKHADRTLGLVADKYIWLSIPVDVSH